MDKNLLNELKAEIIESLIRNACASISMRAQEEINNVNINTPLAQIK
jgi:hypothetical protein